MGCFVASVNCLLANQFLNQPKSTVEFNFMDKK